MDDVALPRQPRMLITGAAGKIGTATTRLLRERGFALRLLDLKLPSAATDADEIVIGSVLDPGLVAEAVRDVDMIVHLAGHADERPWADIISLNVESARIVLDAARDARVGTVVLASSVHAVGFVPSDQAGDRVVPPRPDTYYGLGKVVIEGLGALYADRFGMSIVSARIMSSQERPQDARQLSTMLSPGDFVRLVCAARVGAGPGHHIVWGVSANTRRTVSLEAGRSIGYEPQDDAEAYGDELAAKLGYKCKAEIPTIGSEPLGGTPYTSNPLGGTWEA